MPVYFIQKTRELDGPIKVGFTTDLKRRSKELAAFYKGGITILAVLEDAGRGVEKAIHGTLKETCVRGEWFSRSRLLSEIMRPITLESPVSVRSLSELRADEKLSIPQVQDAKIAKDLMLRFEKVVEGRQPIGKVCEILHEELESLFPGVWTHRRVRAVWAGEARRIDHFEIRHLEELMERIEKQAEWIAPELTEKKNEYK